MWTEIGNATDLLKRAFDLLKEFFKSLRKPYLINTEGNSRHDALSMIKAAFAIDEKILKTELNPKGNKSMKLESLARLNGFESSGAHSALFDTELTVKVLGLLKNKQPELWHEYLKTKSKVKLDLRSFLFPQIRLMGKYQNKSVNLTLIKPWGGGIKTQPIRRLPLAK